jgi:hypothetical protein
MKRKNLIPPAAFFCAALLLAACGAVFTPPKNNVSLVEEEMPELIQIFPVAAEACCTTGSQAASNVIDGNTGTYWGSNYGAARSSADYHAHGTGHSLNIDLGQVYQNITRLEYIPNWAWSIGGYSSNNNGVVREFEVYITEKKLEIGENPPAESLAGYGEWFAFENGSNSYQTAADQKFIATFSSVKGRYIHFRMVSAYRNHWSGYPNISKAANAAEIRVWGAKEAYAINKGSLIELITRADYLRSDYLPKYGYTNAILNNWVGKGEAYMTGKGTKEMIDYVVVNLTNYLAQIPTRVSETTYNRFVPKILWADDRGNHLQAHGGGLLWDPQSEKYWFYGEDRTSANGGGQPGVHAYSSTDLYNWKDEGVALPVFNNTVYNTHKWLAVDWDGDVRVGDTHNSGFVYNVNQWRKSLGDWNCNGIIGDTDLDGQADPGGPDSGDNAYQIPEDLKAEITGRGAVWWDGTGEKPNAGAADDNSNTGYLTDEKTLLDAGVWPPADEAWAKIRDYIPEGNPPLFIEASMDARPHPGALSLDSGRINQFNALYKDEPVWRKKQLYRYYNFQSTIERPKVIYNNGEGSSGNKPWKDKDGNEYPYVMFVHLEGGTYDSSYGTARVAIAAARNPAGPFKLLWAYRIHFVENTRSSDNGLSKGMSRDQSAMVDSDGTAYQFGSTEENRFMCINKMSPDYTQFLGIPEFAAGGNQNEMLQEGYQNRLGENFNWLFANQREAPAPFIHYETADMTLDNSPNDEVKRYYCVTSTSTGWFPNAQGMYATGQLGNWILGNNPHNKPAAGSLSASTGNYSTSYFTVSGQTAYQRGNGWISTINDSGNDGTASTLLMGVAGDGSHVNKGYDGQTTNVFQLRYPAHPWGLTGYLDEAYIPPDPTSYADAQAYYTALEALAASEGYTKPVYGERPELDEPRAGKLVYGKYIYLSDSWDQYKNYDARYIWLPMRVLTGTVNNNTNGPRGLKIRWMNQWRWQDFVYELGPFANSSVPNPAGNDIWNNIDQELLSAYDEMLNAIHGDVAELKVNAGKQNPGLSF